MSLQEKYQYKKEAAISAYFQIRDKHWHTSKMIAIAHKRKAQYTDEARTLLKLIQEERRGTNAQTNE